MRLIVWRAVVPAFHALRAYWGTAVLLAAACAAAIAVLLPVTSLATWSGAGVAPSIGLPPMRSGDLGVVWGAFVRSPTELRRVAVLMLVRLLLGVGAGVLAVTWFTTLTVSTARASGRAVEVAVRRAVGTSGGHLLGAALLEGGAVAVLALVVGGAVGVAAVRLSLGAWPGPVAAVAPTLSLIAVGATLSGVMLGALFPLLFARRSSRIAPVDPTPLGLLVPAAQLGVSLTVLVTASLLDTGAARLAVRGPARSAPGWVYELSAREATPERRAAQYATLLRRLHREPAVATASLTSPGALSGLGTVDVAVSHCGQCPWGQLILEFHSFYAGHYAVSADTFRALGFEIVAGRVLTDADDWNAPRVAVVSRSAAARHFQDGNAVGRRIHVGKGAASWYTVVGVVADRRPDGMGGALEPASAIYLSILQHPAPAVELLVRGRGPAGAAGPVARSLDGTVGPRLSRPVPVSEAALLAAEVAPLTWFGTMFGLEGWALASIATIGTFAMMWLWVASLRQELGVRLAVGARRRDVTRYVLWRALLVALAGVAFGSWLGTMVWDALGGVISGMPAWDAGAVVRYGLVLGAAALAGAWLPARRAARTSPAALLAG